MADLEERPERLIGCLGDYQWPDPQPLALDRLQLPALPADRPAAPRRLRRHPRARRGARRAGRVQLRPGGGRRGSQLRLPARVQARPLLVERLHHRPRLHRRPRPPPARPARKAGQAAPARSRTRSSRRTGDDAVDAEKEQRRQERQQRAEAKEAATRRQLRARPQAAAPLRRAQDHHAGREAAGAADPRPRRGQARRPRPALRPRGLADRRAKEVRGKTVEKTRYPEGYEAAEQLYAQIERARTPEQVIGRLLQALIAAHAADEEALPASAPRLLRPARPLRRRAERRDPDDRSTGSPSPSFPAHLAAKHRDSDEPGEADAA